MATTFAVPDGRVAMAATTYTGTGTSSARSVTGVAFQPDFVWGKGRSVASQHNLFDAVRGSGKRLISNSTAAEETNAAFGYLSSFDSDGFSTLAGSTNNENWNQTSATYVAWSWKAGGTAVSNTAGTITSSVSANTTAGFSIVVYTGNGTNGATVGHGLGAKPSLIIEKGRSTAYNWSVQGCGVLWTPATSTLFLNATNALNVSGAIAAPTTSVFTPSATLYANESGVSNVAYCWAPVAGYSAFGSYTGNGSADGPFIYTGFRPRWIMVKATTAATAYSWVVLDSSRNTYNLADFKLLPNSSVVENDAGAIGGAGVNAFDLVSNGFKSRTSNLSTNESGTTYIYAAFAESAFKFSNAR